jgi:hypothetical protein
MQNKPNFKMARINITSIMTKNYENKSDPTLGENKPNSNPNKPNLPKAQNERKLIFNKGLRQYLSLWGPEKQTQNKANFPRAKK